MVRTTGLKTEYAPIKKINENVYKVSWGYEDMKDPIYEELTPEQQAAEENGEFVERTIIGYKDTDYCTYMYEYMYFKPTVEYLKSFIFDWYNKQIDEKILSGFVWNNMSVWLSTENQFNYKAAYDLAIQTQGQSLPVTFKFGTTTEPVYYTFNNIEEFTQFYVTAMTYINNTLAEGWAKKDAIDWTAYELNEEASVEE